MHFGKPANVIYTCTYHMLVSLACSRNFLVMVLAVIAAKVIAIKYIKAICLL